MCVDNRVFRIYSSVCYNIFFACTKIMRNSPLTLLVLQCFLVCWIQDLSNYLYIAIGIEMMALDNVSITYTMVLHVVTLALHVQSNMKEMILYNMKC